MSDDPEYMRVYMLERYHARMAAARSSLGGACVVCGATKDLNFHHKDPATKAGTIARMGSVAATRFWEEVGKCELRCVAHHHETHAATAEHGTTTRYRRGCRCDPCRAAVARYTLGRRLAKKAMPA